MRRFTVAELTRFLESVDAALDRPMVVIVIGGAAAALGYGAELATADVDTWTGVEEALSAAAEAARRSTGLSVPLAVSGVADGPYAFEGRLERALPHLKHLVVMVPERHDLALMKIVRGYEHDLEAIEAIHRRSPLKLDVLVDRFQAEMDAVIGDPARLKANLLAAVERLFPREVDATARRLQAGRSRSEGWNR